MLRLNRAELPTQTKPHKDSNTTNVKVKPAISPNAVLTTGYSNTTNVKVKPNYLFIRRFIRLIIQIQPMLRLNQPRQKKMF